MANKSILDLFEFDGNETVTIKLQTLRAIESIANDHNEVISKLKTLLNLNKDRECYIDSQDLFYFINKFVSDYINEEGITNLHITRLNPDSNYYETVETIREVNNENTNEEN